MAIPVNWPSTLQQCLSADNFGIAKGATTIRSDMDIGPQKVRRRFTKGVDTYSASIYLTNAQYLIFENYYDVTLNGGATPLIFPHPITQVPTIFRFKDEPQYRPIGGLNWTVSFTWEKLPGV